MLEECTGEDSKRNQVLQPRPVWKRKRSKAKSKGTCQTKKLCAKVQRHMWAGASNTSRRSAELQSTCTKHGKNVKLKLCYNKYTEANDCSPAVQT